MPTVYGDNNQFTVFKKNNDKIMEGQIFGKKLEGTIKLFKKNNIVSMIDYKDGKKEGPFTLFNPKTGIAFKTGYYKNDQIEGEVLIYDERSALTAKEMYKNGHLEGLKESYYPSGQILKQQIYSDNKEVVAKTFYKSGKLLEEKYFNENGQVREMKKYLEDGQVIELFETKKC
ncbi:MAG: hypothetical protein H6850_03895 [Alphaproteobacteria bacterium]|nr:MAG: hypothetical protein H6850_03895 [Alphaproteobacteria bacterium]